VGISEPRLKPQRFVGISEPRLQRAQGCGAGKDKFKDNALADN
jgi:hypothetical protein